MTSYGEEVTRKVRRTDSCSREGVRCPAGAGEGCNMEGKTGRSVFLTTTLEEPHLVREPRGEKVGPKAYSVKKPGQWASSKHPAPYAPPSGTSPASALHSWLVSSRARQRWPQVGKGEVAASVCGILSNDGERDKRRGSIEELSIWKMRVVLQKALRAIGLNSHLPTL